MKNARTQTTLPEFGREFSWHNYNESQTREKALFVRLLRDLCETIEEPAHQKGRKPKPLSDIIYAICLRTYLNMSARRIESDLKLAKESNYISQDIAFNTLLDHLEKLELKQRLQRLIEISALPLKIVELDFAIDATGFSTSRYITYFDVKHRKDSRWKAYRKCHAVCGVKTNIITSVEITEGYVNDNTQFNQLANSTARNFTIREFTADKGYLSKPNYNLIRDLGGQAFIPFKINSTTRNKRHGDSGTWIRMFRLFRDHKKEFMQKYHKRSNIESCFSMIKRKFGNNVRCKKETSQDNEILAKILVHNICVLIQEIFLNNIDIDFDFCAKNYIAR